ncbi:unnamed protein product [Prorocentrum cordatum]|uniref:Uncharacterized protein n=1 Tax=Prorocentrum cordatum TaxID=2364126 RepID=A0ABN9Y5D9_9DINO|nr:unnamed protein product [Polarella glacialis]
MKHWTRYVDMPERLKTAHSSIEEIVDVSGKLHRLEQSFFRYGFEEFERLDRITTGEPGMEAAHRKEPHLSRHMSKSSSTSRRLRFDISPDRHACRDTSLIMQGATTTTQANCTCMCREADLDDESDMELFELADTFQPGDVICNIHHS